MDSQGESMDIDGLMYSVVCEHCGQKSFLSKFVDLRGKPYVCIQCIQFEIVLSDAGLMFTWHEKSYKIIA